MSVEMNKCLCCGINQSGVEPDNADFESILDIASRSASEKDCLALVEIIGRRFTTCVSTSLGDGLLAYEDKDFDNAKRLKVVVDRLHDLLAERNKS